MREKAFNKIDSKDISVVVQGAIDKYNTGKCLLSIRKNLPGAEIILSTWEGSNVDELEYDELVLSRDPGAFPCDISFSSIPNNIDRQIVSTKRGLDKVKRKFCIKMRTDFFLESDNFLNYFCKYNRYDSQYHFLEKRLICCSIYSRNPRYRKASLVMAYCPSDFFFFGLTNDVKKLFYCVEMTPDDEKVFFEENEDAREQLRYKNALCQYMPEQKIWISFLSQYMNDLHCTHRDDLNKFNIEMTEMTFANNLIILDPEIIGLKSFKSDIYSKGIPESCYTFDMWKEIYKKYCKNSSIALFRLKVQTKKKEKQFEYMNSAEYKEEKEKKVLEQVNIIEKPESVIQYIDKFSVISFDIFDTILFRKPDPSWVPTSQLGLNMALVLKKYGYEISTEEINRLRDIIVEEEYSYNLRKGFDREYKFDDLIEKLLVYYNIDEHIRDIVKKGIIENELKREINALYVNEDMLNVLKEVKSRGKRVIAVSDMYLSENEINEILCHFGVIEFIDKIYVSSENGYTKATGRLFEHVLKNQEVNIKEILHIGDNKYSDVINARNVGITCMWYQSLDNINRKQKAADAIIGNKEIDGYFSELKWKNGQNGFSEYIKKNFGIDFWNFVYKIALDSKLKQIEALFFLERDGNLFKEIYDKLESKVTVLEGSKKIDTYLLKLSRKEAACLGDISSAESVIERAMQVNPPRGFQISHVLGCFGLSLEDFNMSVKAQLQKNNYNRRFFCEQYAEIIMPIICNRRESIIKYLEEKNFLKYKNIAVVDIGWGGTIQKDLLKYLKNIGSNIKCFGYYYACDNRAGELRENYLYYRDANSLLYGYSLLEFLIKEYSSLKDNNWMKKVNTSLEQTYILNRKSRIAILECEDIYIKMINNYFLTVDNIWHYCSDKIMNAINNPNKEFLEIIIDVKYSLDRKVGDKYIPLISKVKRREELSKQYTNAQWVQGSKVLSGFITISNNGSLKRIMNRYPVIRRLLWRYLELYERVLKK